MLRALAAATLFAGACTSPSSVNEFAGADVAPLAVQISATPPPDANGLFARNAVLRLVLDDYPDPETAAFGPVLLRSGKGNFDVDVRVDLVGRAILVHPRSLLQPETEYEVLMNPNVRALDGRAIGGTGFAASITTGDVDAIADPMVFQTPPVSWSATVAPAMRNCSTDCHAGSNTMGVVQRALDFDRGPGDPVFGLIDVPSLSQAGTAHPLARVTPGDSARSVLVRKLIGGNAHEASGDPPYPEMGVDGRRMPIQADPLRNPSPPPPFDDSAIAVIQAWIDQGAIVDGN
ncbi:MAG TPA: Ig-like domain-containing protein [Polyangia bacterium]|nr:Ig-like domain-containing protein [Polyangia bacterium]